MNSLIAISLLLPFVLCVIYFVKVVYFSKKENPGKLEDFHGSIAFFHPFCNRGAGGERVLWFMISIIQKKFPASNLGIYYSDTSDPLTIVRNAKDRFNVDINEKSIKFYKLKSEKWILPSSWPHFTLLGQSIGSIILSIEAANKHVPDVLIDTTGFVFIGLVFKILGCKSFGAYVHYPTISTDMMYRVSSRTNLYNNQDFIVRYSILTKLKLLYYQIFAYWYRFGGNLVDHAMTNSQWTHEHISQLWDLGSDHCQIVYPPCSPHLFRNRNTKRNKVILSISQFRPEKDHTKQLDVLAYLLHNPSYESLVSNLKLVMVGSVYTNEEIKYLDSIRNYIKKIGLTEHVDIWLNLKFSELKLLMSESLIGIHTMETEHFGIGIVEMMASGLIVVAHDSGGPKLDIIKPFNNEEVGFLSNSVSEYASAIKTILEMDDDKINSLRNVSIQSVNTRFSDELFEKAIISNIEKLIVIS